MKLHVWGSDGISIISPECKAAAWLLANGQFDITIVTSCNTNLAATGRLPVLVTESGRYEGFERIAAYVTRLELADHAGISFVEEHLHPINQYNLYINTKNYEQHTRKLFKHYFPFPMMYNQPLRLYNDAQETIKTIGLGVNKIGFFSMSGNFEEPVPTELVDDEEPSDEVAISALHEKQILAKSKRSTELRESRNSLKCLTLLGQYLAQLVPHVKPDSSTEYLLYAYIWLMTQDLPDNFVRTYLEAKMPDFYSGAREKITGWEQALAKLTIRSPTGPEVPSLWNEVQYQTGVLAYP